MEELKPIIKSKKFDMFKVADYMRMTWVFDSNLEKALLVTLIILGIWKLFGVVYNLVT